MFVSPRFAEYMKHQKAEEMARKVGGAEPTQATESKSEAQKSPEKEHAEAIKDQHHSLLPHDCLHPPKKVSLGGTEHAIEETLNRARAKYPGAQQDALNAFAHELKFMTPGEVDDIKDSIVDHMADPSNSQWDRELFQKMYHVADSISEHHGPNYK